MSGLDGWDIKLCFRLFGYFSFVVIRVRIWRFRRMVFFCFGLGIIMVILIFTDFPVIRSDMKDCANDHG